MTGLGIGIMEFIHLKVGLGMELEYGKFHAELYSHSGIQVGFPTLKLSNFCQAALQLLSLEID